MPELIGPYLDFPSLGNLCVASRRCDFISKRRIARQSNYWRFQLDTRLITVKDIENALQLGHTKVSELIRTGEIESFKIGRRRMSTPEALKKFIERKFNDESSK